MARSLVVYFVTVIFCCLALGSIAQEIYSIYDLFPSNGQHRDCPYRTLRHGRSIPQELNYVSSSTVRYFCNNGYTLLGSETANCEDGKWSRNLPFCTVVYRPSLTTTEMPLTTPKLVECPPRILENGKIIPSKMSYNVRDRVVSKCFEGFTMDGPRASRCLKTGAWDASLPVCKENPKPRYCDYRNLKFGMSSPPKDKYADREIVTFKCKAGYGLKGKNAMVCFNGRWTAELPVCEAKPKICSYRKLIHGSEIPSKAFYENLSVVLYNCNKGYNLRGEVAAACFHGEWSAELPECTSSTVFSPSEIVCRAPDFPRGSYTPRPEPGKMYSIGSQVSFRCSGVYNLKGSRTAECLARGEWNQIPECEAGCRRPQISNGFYNHDFQLSGTYFERGNKITIGCNPGYYISGKATATCLARGRWSVKLPFCIEITIAEVGCLPPVFSHGSYTPVLPGGKTVYSVGERVDFICRDGYHTQGQNYATCLSDGGWTKFPSCSDECTPPKVTQGSIRGISNRPFNANSIIVLNCNAGYLPIGPSSATCLPSGIWSAQLRCSDGCYAPTISRMKVLPAPAAGGTVYEFGHRIRFRCDAGFSTNVREAECRGNNKWDRTLPKCRVLSAAAGCAMPTLTEGLLMKNQRQAVFQYKTQLEFNCDRGFSMIGSAVSICRKHLKGLYGGWDPSPPVCNRAKCGAPGRPQNGRFQGGQKDAYYFGDKVYFECDNKHIMSGNDHITCQANGQFSGIPPKCQPPSCRVECKLVEGRDCQCDAICRMRGDCCRDFEQHCRKLFY